MKALYVFAMIAVVFTSGCTEILGEQKPMNQIAIRGHDNQIYEFSYDIRETSKILSNDPAAIKKLIDGSHGMVIVFDGSNETDNARFSVAIYNTITKLQTYYAFEGKVFDSFPVFYHVGDLWYNETGGEIPEPVTSEPVFWLRGPGSGAYSTSVNIDGTIVNVQGASGRDIERAAEKFVLIVFGMENPDG